MKTSPSSNGLLTALIVIAVMITAAVHLILGIRDLANPMGVVFVLNALGFAGLTTMYFAPIPFLSRYRSLIRWGLVSFSAVTFILYFVFNGLKIDLVSGTAKAAELLLIVLLLLDRKRE